jgi:hypothetical protein
MQSIKEMRPTRIGQTICTPTSCRRYRRQIALIKREPN